MSIQLDDLIARLRLDTSGVSTGLSSVDSKLSSVGTSATNAGKKLSLGVTAPLVGVGIAATNLAAGFDKTMRQVAIATGGPSKALEDLAMTMGAETAFSAGEAADAMLELAKGGMTAAQIQGGALAATMKLASAGGVDLASASTYVSNSMAAFGLAAKDADKVTVALAGAANASSASVQSLGLGLSQAASSARNAGLSLQETTGVLSYFDSVGLKGSDAGTSLKSMFNGLIPSTSKAAVAMEKANLNFVDAEGNFVSVANMAEQLQKGLGGLGEAQRAQALETIFGSDGMRAASALMRGGADAVEKYTKASKDAKTTTELANAAMEGTSGAMERAKGSIETAMLTLGQQLAPYVEAAAGFVERMANAFTMLPDPVKKGVVIVGALLAVLGPLLVTVGFISTGLAGLAGALAVVSTPVLLIVGGLALLGVALATAYARSETFRAQVSSAFAQVSAFIQTSLVPAALRIQAAFMALVAVVVPIVRQIVGVVVGQMPAIRDTIERVFSAVKSIITSAMSIVRSVIQIATAAIKQVWATFGGTILSTIERVFSAMLQVVRGVFGILQGLFRTVAAVLKGDWKGAWDGIKQIVSGAGDVIVGLVKGSFALVRGAFSAVGDIMQSLASSAWTAVKDTFGKGVADAVAKVKEIKGKISDAFSGAKTWLSDAGRAIVEGLGAGIESMYQWVRDKVDALSGWIPGWVKKRLGIASPSKVMHQLGVYIAQGLADGIVGGTEKVRASMTKLTDLLREASRKGLVKLANETGDRLDPLAQKYDRLTARLAAARDKLQQLQDSAEQLRDTVQQAFDATGSFGNVRGRTEEREITETDEQGNVSTRTATVELPITAQDVIDAKAGAAARAEEFAQVLTQLKAAGLSQPQLDELARSGPQMLEVARATLAGGAEAIAALNAYQAHIEAQGAIVANLAAQNMYGAGIAATDGLIRGLEERQGAVTEAMEKLARRLVRALKKALKISSPSRVLDELGQFTGIGFAQGIESTTRAVARASDSLAAAAIVTPPALAFPSAASAAASHAAALAQPSVTPTVRVFIGDRELTDIVRVELGDAVAPLTTAVRQGA